MTSTNKMWKFKPIDKPTIWGGERWEISGMPDAESVVESGDDKGLSVSALIDKYDAQLLGERIYRKYGNRFPLLVKFINADRPLSVQVHPDDELAARRGHNHGKSEMWYVAETGPGAKIANGFQENVNPEEYDSLVSSGKIEDVLNFIDIHPGDIFYIPAGRVHAICGECMIVEIQQPSDVTYRIYDYNRLDSEGNPRELHTDLAREAINFNDTGACRVVYQQRDNIPVNVLKTPHFCTNLLSVDTELMRDYSESDSFVILICTEGEADIISGDHTSRLTKGNTLLVPASTLGLTIRPDGKASLIETYIS